MIGRIIVNRVDWFGSSANIKSKQRYQDLGWKVHDRAQSFVLRSYTMHGYVTNTFLLASSSVRSKQLLCFVHGQGQKREQKPTTKKFVTFPNHSPLLTMVELSEIILEKNNSSQTNISSTIRLNGRIYILQ